MDNNDLFIIDNFIDDREFRNYVSSLLSKKGFKRIVIDDVTLSNEDTIDDNDMRAELDGVTYTIQTFLNTIITQKEIDEVEADMDYENVSYAILVTNKYVDQDVKQYAKNLGIEVWDREVFI